MQKKYLLLFLSVFIFTACSTARKIAAPQGFDATLTEYQYPFPVFTKEFKWQDQKVSMAYMDLKPQNQTAATVVLLHGKNFGGYYFEKLAKTLNDKGYRVVIPDQVGFGKSSKPHQIQYSFHGLAQNTFALLEDLQTGPIILVGHSMGGMLAARMTLVAPEKIKKLILVNPIGLEDYKVLTGYKSVDQLWAMEKQNSPEKIKQYQLEFYYNGQWKPEYGKLNEPAEGWMQNPRYDDLAKVSALTAEMIYTQPVFYEFKNIQVPTVLINGDLDRTAIGKGWAPEKNKKRMGDYPQLGRQFQKTVKGSQLVELKGKGHVPFIEDFQGFFKVFEKALN